MNTTQPTVGMLRVGSLRRPERLHDAMMPETDGKKMPTRMVNEEVMSATTCK